jgi:hypothetical protein
LPRPFKPRAHASRAPRGRGAGGFNPEWASYAAELPSGGGVGWGARCRHQRARSREPTPRGVAGAHHSGTRGGAVDRPPKEGRYPSIRDAASLAQRLAIGVRKLTVSESAGATPPTSSPRHAGAQSSTSGPPTPATTPVRSRSESTGVRAGISRRHEKGIGGCAHGMLLAESATDFTLFKPLRDKTGQ